MYWTILPQPGECPRDVRSLLVNWMAGTAAAGNPEESPTIPMGDAGDFGGFGDNGGLGLGLENC